MEDTNDSTDILVGDTKAQALRLAQAALIKQVSLDRDCTCWFSVSNINLEAILADGSIVIIFDYTGTLGII